MNTDLISRADAEALFRTARSKLNPSDYKSAYEFNTRDLMLLNAEQMIHLLPSVTPQEPKASNSENPNKCEDCISRQAAIDTIESWLSCDDYNEAERHIMRAAQSVLYDLPSVQPIPCNYAISRAEVHDLLATWLSDKLDEKTREVLEVIDGKVEDMSSVTPKQRTGHWIKTQAKQGGISETWYNCSECGWRNAIYLPRSFCPNCGCRMIEPQESDHKCHTCKHYTSGENDGSCGSYICKGYSNWESEG